MAPARTESPPGTSDEVYDILIVGAGPCGLATAARLRERTPAALFTDEEHRRFHWIRKHGRNVSLKKVVGGNLKLRTSARQPRYSMCVLDGEADRWLGRWNRLFETYDITHLRSPMLWHVDPQDRDSLVGMAWMGGREKELIEIKNCVGQEVSKHGKKKKQCGKQCGGRKHSREVINQREHYDYYRPSQALFCDHCDEVAQRYGLSDDSLISQENVEDIDYDVVRGVSADDDDKLFTVTSDKTTRYARTVILAVGPASSPNLPLCPSMPKPTPGHPLPQASHAMHVKHIPDPVVQSRIDAKRPTNILVVGGGLTSAQISDLAVRRGATKVWHLMRGPLKLRPFDVSLEWMGKYKNTEHARFWLADSDEERMRIIDEARNGGSITHNYHKILQKHIAAGRLELRQRTQLVDAKFEQAGPDGAGGYWSVQTEPPVPGGLPPLDYIYFATGITTSFASLPYLGTMLAKHPVQDCGGFPCLTEDLSWGPDVPLFVTGRLASLRIGPSAPNIGGAKLSAERIAWAVEDLARRGGWDAELEEGEGGEAEGAKGGLSFGYASGHGNRFGALEEE